MPLRVQLEQQLLALYASRAAMPTSLQVSESSGITLRLELSQVDSMSCAFSELVLYVPHLQNATFDVVKQWAADLSQRITYLLEKIGPLEFDPNNRQVLIRSTPPQAAAHGTRYYEIVLSSAGQGSFILKRFESIGGQPGRNPVDLQLTNEVLFKLVDDLVATIPSVP